MYKAETNKYVYVLFLFVHGELPGIQGMTQAQTAELAEILALLHDTDKNIPFETHRLNEDISLDFCEKLAQFLNNLSSVDSSISNLISPHAEMLHSVIKKVLLLRNSIRLGYSPLVLCHGDAHGNNVIQSERLVLADWEDLRYAPAEADLFIYAWHKHGDVLLDAYTAARNGYQINRELLYFYILRRRIEDVWVDIQRLNEESPDEIETIKLTEYIQQGITNVRTAYYSETTLKKII